jgi:outer membrane protein OmpA-like peptidoglycan-associated protein/opacity protein-like surface antigen
MRRLSLAVLMLCLMGASSANAFDWFGGRLSIGGGYGRAKPKLPYSYQDNFQDGEMWTGHIKYFLNNNVSLVASYADLDPYRRGNKGDTYRFRPIVGSVRYNIFRHLPFTPYLTAGAGYAINKHEVPGLDTVKWDGFTYQGGLGLEFFITEGTSLGAEALYHHFEADGDNHPYRLVSAVGTVNFYFGPGPSQKRTEEALEKEKAEAERARAEAEAAKQQAQNAQQGAAQTQEQLTQAQKDAAAASAAQAAANQKTQEMQAKMQQEQAELDSIKQMIAHKDISPITFKTGSAELVASSDATLDKIAETIKKYPDLKLRIEGHTDSVGEEAYNVRLSQKRADAVKNYLVTKAGVTADEVTAIGVGKAGPIADNDSPEGRAQNRRVEFITYIQ